MDQVLEKIMNYLNIEIPEYSHKLDPTKHKEPNQLIEWTIQKTYLKHMKELYEQKCKNKKRKSKDLIENVKKKEIKSEYV